MDQNFYLNRRLNDLVLNSNALTLEKSASYRVALMVWRDELIDCSLKYKLPLSSDDVAFVVEAFRAKYDSTICSYLLNLVASAIRRIGKELTNWLWNPYDGLDREPFVKRGETWMKYFDQLAWFVEDYTLDYWTTCHNLLQSDRVCVREKFAMACVYCLENRVINLWTCVSEYVEKSGHVLQYTCTSPRLLSYWIDCMKSQSSSEYCIWNTFDADELIENIPTTPWVIGYFWPYFTSDIQFRLVVKTVSAKDAFGLKYLFSNINETVWQRILNENAEQIMCSLMAYAELRPLAMLFWRHVADTYDAQEFFEMIQDILGIERSRENEVCLYQQIWAYAPNHLKNYVLSLLSIDSSAFKKPIISADVRYCDKRLVKMVLSEASPEQGYRIWNDNWLKFCMHATKWDMNDMIEMCLNDTSERMEFKRENMMKLENIQSYCFHLLDEFEFAKLNDFLMFCAIDSDASAELKRRLLRSYCFEGHGSFSDLYFRRIDRFVLFINECFPNPVESASFRKEFIKCHTNVERFVEWLYDGEFDLIENLVAAFSSDEQDVREWKEEFKQYCQYSLSTGSIRKFNAVQWQNFMMWCLGSDDKVAEFKRCLDVDRVFSLLFERGDSSEQGARHLPDIFYEFLEWSWGSEYLPLFKQAQS